MKSAVRSYKRGGVGPVLSEVAGPVGGVEVEGGEAVGVEAADSVGVLEGAADEEGGGLAGESAVTGPEAGAADDVEHAGLVLEVEEGDAARGGGWFVLGDGANQEDAGAVRDFGDRGSR